MFSKILIKLIDQAIVPALLLLVTRVVTVIGYSNFFNVYYIIDSSGFVFDSPSDYVMINSYSLFTMLSILTIGMLYILIKSLVFHDTHIEPKMTAKLFSLRLSSFIQTSFDIYSQGVVWLSYIYLMFFVVSGMVLFGFLYRWVFYASLVLTLISTVVLVLDIENEIDPNADSFDEILDEEEYVLEFK